MKALIHLTARELDAGSFESRVRESARMLRPHPTCRGLRVNAMLRLPGDRFGPRTPYRAAFELLGDEREAIEAATEELVGQLEGVAELETSTLLMGEDVVFVACQQAPVRYQYLMRRNERFDHSTYLERYREVHSAFGLKTPGILGYVQFHVDAGASERAARRCGLGVWDVDSVSELHLESVDHFLAAIAGSSIAREAAEDEAVFVDRERSYDFCSVVDWHA